MTGFLLFLLSLITWPLVMLYAIKGNYPEWMITTDDPESPFGQYEATVKGIYEKYGRYCGDVYWLGFRNTLYGLAYKLKPDWLKRIQSYKDLPITKTERGILTTIKLFDLREYTLNFGVFHVILGNRLSPIYNGKDNPVRMINMDGRPIFSIRKADGNKW